MSSNALLLIVLLIFMAACCGMMLRMMFRKRSQLHDTNSQRKRQTATESTGNADDKSPVSDPGRQDK